MLDGRPGRLRGFKPLLAAPKLCDRFDQQLRGHEEHDPLLRFLALKRSEHAEADGPQAEVRPRPAALNTNRPRRSLHPVGTPRRRR